MSQPITNRDAIGQFERRLSDGVSIDELERALETASNARRGEA